jgi:hypothetical protein
MVISAKEFQDYASDCLQWARQAESDSERDTCLEMAAAGLRASTAAGLAVPPNPGTTPQQPQQPQPKKK